MSSYILTPIDFNPFEEEKEIDKIVFTNEPQKEIWLSCTIGGDEANLAYNESVSLDLKGVFQPTYFIEAIKEVVSRHEALRAVVSANGETLIIYKALPFEISVSDLSNETDPEATIAHLIEDEMQKVFDLQAGPLFRVFLHRLAGEHYVFTLVKHHVIGDGWSTGVILEDLSKCYNAKVEGICPVLDPAAQISDYAREMAAFEQQPEYFQTSNYWLDMYKDNVPVLDLPTDRPRPSTRTYHAKRFDQDLPLILVADLKKMGAKSGCSFVNTLLSAFEIFLHLQTSQSEIVVGLPAAGQAATGHFDLVGHCVNLLPLKTTIDQELSFSDYLKQRKKAFFDAYDHQQFTFGQLVKQLKIKRDTSRIPLVPVVFNIDMGMDNAVVFDQLEYTLISNPRSYETFELFLNATGSKSRFVLEWSYNTQLFNADTIEQMASKFEALLLQLIDNPSVLIKELSAKNTASWLTQLTAWNDTKVAYDKNTNLFSMIRAAGLQFPDQTAITFQEEQLDYKTLIIHIEQFAAYLSSQGIKSGDIIGLATDRSIEMVICMLGILKAGAVYLPLDPEFPHDRIEYMLSDSKAKILLVSKAYSAQFTSGATEIVIEQIWPGLVNQEITATQVAIGGTDLAYILYTSGSTGKPKGVEIRHDNLVNFLLSMQKAPGIAASDRLLAITTISFDIAGLELYLPLITGANLVLCDTETARDGRLLLDLIREKHITIMQATPSTWRMMMASGWTERFPLKVLCGGEALPKDLADELIAKCASLWNMYGPTETTIWSTVKQIDNNNTSITIGRPIDNTKIYIVNEAIQLVPPGNEGEILIGGDGLAAGYLNQPGLTAERFIEDPFSNIPGARLYRTGDLGKFNDDGEIICLGRLDQQVKIRGHRIELGEIESCLSNLEGINQAVVVAREDLPGEKKLVGYVVLEEDSQKSVTPTWKDRWDTIYDMAAQSSEGKEQSEQKIDGILLEQWQDSEKLVQQASEWLEVSVERIKKLHAQHILEIGSGGGQLMFELAPYASSYLATDYAETAIEKLQQKLDATPAKWKHVTAKANAADDFTELSNKSFDLIVIHSVAQYFPDTQYFLKVIEESLKHVQDGGCLFIGDMQGKNTLTMYHAMDHLSHSRAETTIRDFQEVVNNRVRIEDEFVADPAFFYLLPKLIPSITAVDIQLRKGQSENETTKYHYDVWIYVNSDHQILQPELQFNWKDLGNTDALATLLRDQSTNCIELKGVFNARTAKDYALSKLLSTAAAATHVEEIKKELTTVDPGYQPDLFWKLGEQLGYETHIRWTTDGTDGTFDVVFIKGQAGKVLPAAPSSLLLNGSRPGDYAKTPLSTNELFISKVVVEGWKDRLRAVLPEYMLPVDFVALKTFPLTPNQKIDKKALPKPQLKTDHGGSSRNEPKTENEKLITEIWSAVLGLEDIDIKDDFFELGGHSLLAVKVMAAIEKETGKRLPLATLFDNANIEKLAKKLDPEIEEEKWDALVPIKTSGTKDPIFMVHGGGLNVLVFKSISNYLDEDQPLYGLQALGLNRKTHVPSSIEEIAAVYVSEVLKVNPDGPYCLAGYSLGGFIAFEMARQLIGMGKVVKFLGIMDTYAGDTGSSVTTSGRLFKKIKRQFHKIPFFVRSFFNNPGEAIRYQLLVLGSKISDHHMESYTQHFTSYEQEIYKNYDIAHNSYRLSPIDIKINIFTVRKRLYYLDDLVYLGWNKFTSKGVNIYDVPGDHKTFLYPPNDDEFAGILQSALNKL